MTSVFFDFRIVAGYVVMSMACLLYSSRVDARQPDSQNVYNRADGSLWYSATLSYEDRQMMKNYLLQQLTEGVVAVVEIQAQIDGMHESCPNPHNTDIFCKRD